MYSKMHSEADRGSHGLAIADPVPSTTTSSPGSSSRSSRAPMMSSAQVSDASTTASSSRPTTSGRIPSGSRNPATASSVRSTAANAPSIRPIASATASSSGPDVPRDQGGDHLGVGRRLQAHAIAAQLGAQPGRVREVAVVAERNRAPGGVLDDRLGVPPRGRPGRRVARVPDRHASLQRRQLRLVEHLADQPHVLHRDHPLAVGHCDSGALLAAVLERVEAEEGEPGDVTVGGADRVEYAEHAAHQAPPSTAAGSADS